MLRYRLLILITLLAAGLRLIALDSFPIHPSVDEVAIGYDAFSLISTGRDHYQAAFPLTFASIGDYKPPLYIYLTVLPVKIFGLNEFSTRLPAALFGILAIPLVYFLSKELFKNWRFGIYLGFGAWKLELEDITALLLAISPWHLRFSRGPYEATVALTFSLTGLLFLLRYLKLHRISLFALSTLHFALSFYSYHSPKIFLPVFLLLFAVFKSQYRRSLALLLLLLLLLLVPASFSRGSSLLVTSDPEIHLTLGQFSGNALLARTFLYTTSLAARYLQYFDPNFWVASGLHSTFSQFFDQGAEYLVNLPLLVTGLIWLLRRRPSWLAAWLLAAPLPAALTLNDYHPIRSFPLVIPGVILTAVGLSYLRSKVGKIIYLLALFSFTLVTIDLYFVHLPVQRSHESFYPFRDIALYALSQQDNYDRIIIDPAFGPQAPNILGIPDLYLLFYGRIPPEKYWQTKHDEGFAKFTIRHIEWYQDRKIPRTLFIGSIWSLPQKDIPASQILRVFNFKNATPAYLAVSSQ